MPNYMANKSKQLRLSKNTLLAGVIAGIAEYVGMDVTVLRVLFAALVVFTGIFPGVFLYIIAYIIMAHNEKNQQ
jgi:phage shock protein C